MKNNTTQVSEEMIGKFVNRYLYTDVQNVGKIIDVKGKTTIVVEIYQASKNKTKMEFVAGGFSAVCLNNTQQSYEFTPTGQTIEMRIGKSFSKQYGIDENPRKHYDYNF